MIGSEIVARARPAGAGYAASHIATAMAIGRTSGPRWRSSGLSSARHVDILNYKSANFRHGDSAIIRS
jgi:hypothetical protein